MVTPLTEAEEIVMRTLGRITEGPRVEEDFVGQVQSMSINHVTVNIVLQGSVIESGSRALQSCVGERHSGASLRKKGQANHRWVITVCLCGNARVLSIHKSEWWRLEEHTTVNLSDLASLACTQKSWLKEL